MANKYLNERCNVFIWILKIKLVSKFIKKIVRLICLTVFNVHKDCIDQTIIDSFSQFFERFKEAKKMVVVLFYF